MAKHRITKAQKKKFSEKLRRNPTVAESVLWQKGLRPKLNPTRPKFQRQIIVQGYIVDFYCPRARLAVEIDGAYHRTKFHKGKDSLRTLRIAKSGVSVIRFRNEEVIASPERVAGIIFREAKRRIELFSG